MKSERRQVHLCGKDGKHFTVSHYKGGLE